jgi:hypothetical protein
MVGSWRTSALGGVVVDGGGGPGGIGGHVVLGDLPHERMADEDVVDQFPAASVDPAESLLGGDARRKVPQPFGVALVGAVEACGTDLGAGWSVEDLWGGGLDFRR